MRVLSLLRVCGLLALIGLAIRTGWSQPSLDDAWITLRLLQADATPFTAPVTVRTTRVVDLKRPPAGRQVYAPDGSLTVIGLVPGTHEMTINLDTLGLVDGPKTFEIMPGANDLTWTLPPLLPVRGNLLADGAPAVATTSMAYLSAAGMNKPLLVPSALERGAYRLPRAIFPGDYRLLLLTNIGYGFADISAIDAEHTTVGAITLTPGGTISIEVSTANGAKLPGIPVVFRRNVERGFTPAVTVVTDKQGRVVTPMLPPGDWRWSIVMNAYTPINGTVKVTVGTPASLTPSLVKR